MFSKKVGKIELQQKKLKIGSNVTIIGWGRTSSFEPISIRLKYNDAIHVQANDVCGPLSHSGVICLDSDYGNGACEVNKQILVFDFFINQFPLTGV